MSRPDPFCALISVFDTAALGLRSIQAELVGQGFGCDLIMFRDQRIPVGVWPSDKEYELLGELLRERRPRAVGVSLRSFAVEVARRITDLAREAGVPLVIWGGTHPTLAPEECITVADAVCIGEGEQPMLELCRALSENAPITNLQNLWVREGDQVHRNPLRSLRQDLDALAFPLLGDEGKFTIEHDQLLWEDTCLSGRRPVSYYISASRGCPFQCAFCCNTALRELHRGLGPWVRKRSPENVIAELERAKAGLDLRYVAFMDELFSQDAAWTRSICEQYQERVGVPFKCEVHPRTLDQGLVADMKAAGLQLAVLGVQSGSERTRRDDYQRRTTNAEILAAARAFHEQEVLTYYDFIFDNPYESEADLDETLKLILELPRPHNMELFSLAWFPGTDITRRALADGKLSRDQVEDRSHKSFADFWAEPKKCLDKENAFYVTLAWLELLKLNRKNMELISFAAGFGESFHLVPKWTIRLLSKSRFLRKHPLFFYRLMKMKIRFLKGPLLLLRKIRTAGRLLKNRLFPS